MSLSMAVALVFSALLGIGGANAAPTTADPGSYMPAPPLPIEASSPKVKADFDAHLAKVKEEIRVNGGKIVGEQKVAYEPAPAKAAGKKAGSVTPMAFPSGCGLYVITYFDYHSNTYSSAVHSALTSCTYSVYYIGMDSILNKYDTYWGWWDQVGEGSNAAYYVSSLTSAATFTCTTGNNSGFSGSTTGELYSGGTRYTAAAYDGTYFWACGN
ncbi:hypothetical protein [Arthrobacter ramosus]|uniref:Secreted protein n=2 Tax=Arthrobacter TaxID=1663 RepID=A0ABV5Y4M8_ARTRM